MSDGLRREVKLCCCSIYYESPIQRRGREAGHRWFKPSISEPALLQDAETHARWVIPASSNATSIQQSLDGTVGLQYAPMMGMKFGGLGFEVYLLDSVVRILMIFTEQERPPQSEGCLELLHRSGPFKTSDIESACNGMAIKAGGLMAKPISSLRAVLPVCRCGKAPLPCNAG